MTSGRADPGLLTFGCAGDGAAVWTIEQVAITMCTGRPKRPTSLPAGSGDGERDGEMVPADGEQAVGPGKHFTTSLNPRTEFG